MSFVPTKSGIHAQKSHGTTKKQMAVLSSIAKWVNSRGYPPTFRELAKSMDINVSDVFQKLVRLRRDGVVEWEDGKCRTLRIVGGE